jgi:hypothetical protein
MKVASGVAITLLLVLGAGLALTAREQPPVALPTPSPTAVATATVTPETPSPSPSPTPEPTVAATPVRTQRPRPTTNVAGMQLMTYYFQTRAQFGIFPPTPQIDFDEPADENGDAWYRGLNAAGQPIFTVREDYAMTPSTAFHELGHAYQDLARVVGGVVQRRDDRRRTREDARLRPDDQSRGHEGLLHVAHAGGAVVARAVL